MRRITLKKNKDKRERRSQILIAVLLVGIMLFSAIGYTFQSAFEKNQIEKVTYNGFEFVKYGSYWVTQINGEDFLFQYNPLEIEERNISLNLIETYYSRPLYVYPSETNEAIIEIRRNLDPLFRKNIVQRVQEACVSEEECKDKNLPTRDCSENFIIVRESEESKIRQTRNCVYLEGKKEDFVMLADEFLFHLLGIRQ